MVKVKCELQMLRVCIFYSNIGVRIEFILCNNIRFDQLFELHSNVSLTVIDNII